MNYQRGTSRLPHPIWTHPSRSVPFCLLCDVFPIVGGFVFFWLLLILGLRRHLHLGSLRPSTEPKTPKPRKVSKKSPERSLGPPDPGPPKSSEKSPKSPKNSQNQLFFFDFSDLFRNFLGVRGQGGPKLLSGDFFETFRGFRVLGSVDGRRDPKSTLTDQNLSSAELESGNAIGAFLQTPAPVLDKISGPMGARFLSSTGLGSGNLLGRAQFPQPALDENPSPIHIF